MEKIFRFRKNTDGQSLVEFALVLPFLIALILGMIEFGWILNAKITLTSAAREGARFYAATKDVDNVRRTVEDTAQNSGLTITDVIPSTEHDYGENVFNVKVIVKGSIKPIIGLYIPGGIFYMESTAIMREE